VCVYIYIVLLLLLLLYYYARVCAVTRVGYDTRKYTRDVNGAEKIRKKRIFRYLHYIAATFV